MVAYRVSRAGPVNIAAIKTDPSKEGTTFEGPIAVPCSQDEVLSVFQGWEPEAVALLKVRHVVKLQNQRLSFTQCLKQPIKWALNALPPLSSFAKGRVALVGDAVCFQPPSS